MLRGAEQGGEAGGGVEPREAEPVDRAVAGDQGASLAVPDQRVVFDPCSHLFHQACGIPRVRVVVYKGSVNFQANNAGQENLPLLSGSLDKR